MPGRKRKIFSLLMAFNRGFGERMRRKKGSDFNSMLRMVTLLYVKTATPTMKELATHLSIRPPSATSLVQSMEKAGLLTREPDKEDRRALRIRVTEKGERALGLQRKTLEATLEEMLKPLSGKEQEGFIRILEKIT